MERIAPLFSFRGRTSRGGYWAAGVPINAVIWGFIFLVARWGEGIVWYVGLVLIAAFLVGLYLNLALAVRRLHDLGRSWWWAVLYLVVPAAMPIAVTNVGSPEPLLSLSVVVMLLGPLIGLVDMGARRGVAGANRHGPDPLNPSPAEIFA